MTIESRTRHVAALTAAPNPLLLALLLQLLMAAALMLVAGGARADDAADAVSAPTDTLPEAAHALLPWWFEAARRGDDVLLDEFIAAGMPLDVGNEKGYTALILAAYNGHLETVQRLLDAGADACARDHRGNTALLGATFKGELRIARLLLAQPCTDVDAPNAAGQTVDQYAQLFGRDELHALIAERRAAQATQESATAPR